MKSKSVSCEQIIQHICDSLDGQINSPKCREIKKHLEACPNCKDYLSSVKKTIHLYRKYPSPKLTRKCRKMLFAVLRLK